MFKTYIQNKLESYVRKYFAAHPSIKLVVVAGSVGKTSTKLAIATLLSERYRVRLHEGNHNMQISAPVAILGIEYPDNVRSIGAWLSVFRAARRRIKDEADVDVVVQEISADHPGDIAQFSRYLHPDIAVITAVSPEHMEFFGSLDAVAKEELSAANFSKMAIINRDDIDGEYAKFITNANLTTYGTSSIAEYYFEDKSFSVEHGHRGLFVAPEFADPVDTTIRVIGEHNLRPVVAAGAVAVKLGVTREEIERGFRKVVAAPGRMNCLAGADRTTLIDDTYNSSPLAAASAIRTLYSLQAPVKIAVLGSMNELGDQSEAAHRELGMLCDGVELSWVITVGEDANRFIAPMARSRGCQVHECANALEAGAFVRRVTEKNAIILFKGSEGRIYLEEAVKMMLHSTADERYLVRQSTSWRARKNAFFAQFSS